MGGKDSKVLCCVDDREVRIASSSRKNSNININEKEQISRRKSSYQSDHYQGFDELMDDKNQKKREKLIVQSQLILGSSQPLLFDFNKYNITKHRKGSSDISTIDGITNQDITQKPVLMIEVIIQFLQQRFYVPVAPIDQLTLPSPYLNQIHLISNQPSEISEVTRAADSQNALEFKQTQRDENDFNEMNSNQNYQKMRSSYSKQNKVKQLSSSFIPSNSSANNSPVFSPMISQSFELALLDENSDSNLKVYLKKEQSKNSKYFTQVIEYELQGIESLDEYLSNIEIGLSVDICDYLIESKKIIFQQQLKHKVNLQVIHVIFQTNTFKRQRDLLYIKITKLIDDNTYIIAFKSIVLQTEKQVSSPKDNSASEIDFDSSIRPTSSYSKSNSRSQGRQIKKQPTQKDNGGGGDKYLRVLLGLSGKRVVFNPDQKTISAQEIVSLDMKSNTTHYAQKQLLVHQAKKRIEKIKSALASSQIKKEEKGIEVNTQ